MQRIRLWGGSESVKVSVPVFNINVQSTADVICTSLETVSKIRSQSTNLNRMTRLAVAEDGRWERKRKARQPGQHDRVG